MCLDANDVGYAVEDGGFDTVFQPIYSLCTGDVVALEALTRFTAPARVPPGTWFGVAHEAGMGVDLELATLRGALRTAADLTDHIALWANLSPAALVEPRTLGVLEARDTANLVIEVTEQPSAGGYARLIDQLERVRALGVGVAVDDVGGNRASYRHLRQLRPELVKADLSITATLDGPWPRHRLAADLIRTARHQGAQLVAEGVETRAQLDAWRRLGADLAQGYYLARPSPLEEALQAQPLEGVREPVAVAG